MGQETTGSITGQVVDSSGSAIPNAKVEVSGVSLPRAMTVTTDSSGTFSFPSLPGGSYVVSATAAGFSTQKTTGVAVSLGRASRLEFKMEVGQITESVVVSADAAMVDTASSSSSVNVDKSFFDLMPKGRGFYDLINLAPGARNEGKSGGYQVDGASGSENTFYLDGMEVTNIQTGVLSGQNRIPVEMVQQVQVKNGVMEAQYGGAMGGVINASVRSGTNEIHGTVGMYYNNDSMSARLRPTLQMDPTDTTRSKTRYFQNTMDDYTTINPIFSVGGPLVKNKLFFYSAYMPTNTNTNRNVTFLSDGVKGTYTNKYRQQYLTNKLDFAPFSKLRMNASWMWNPNYSKGSLPARDGTDSSTNQWAKLGNYSAGNTISGQVDYLASSKLIISFRGGYNYSNYTDRYSIPETTAIYYSNSNVNSPLAIPADLRGTAGWRVQAVGRTDYNIYKRINLNADASYLVNWKGQHNIKGGWQTNRLSNDVLALTYPNGYYRYYWGQSYTCVTSQCSGKQTGDFGYYRYRLFGTSGAASSDNQGIFLQDNWRVNKYLSLNLGIRTEREFLPSFSSGSGAAAPPVEFGWSKKFSPRIGGAWDPKGDGKMRLYASWGYFYDVMKYEMPRGSFGGDVWWDYYFSLGDPNLVKTLQGVPKDPKALPGKFFEAINWRIPSNDPANPTIDKNLEPMKQRMLDLGFDYSLSSTLVASLRYTNRRLIRTIEDVGTLGPDGEIYYIANPGFGLTVDPKTWEAGIPVTPKAKRNYDALEMRLDKRFSKNYQFAASYTYSKSTGNYSGLASSDENGRTSPNVNRYFDLPWIGYTEKGTLADGVLATDRPNTFKVFGGYTLKSILGHTTLSPNMALYSGIPLTTNINVISSTPAYPYGRGDMGRTPVFYNFDLNLMHDFPVWKAKESMKVRFEFTVFNLLNSSIVTDKSVNLLHPDDGQLTFAHDADFFKGFSTAALMKAQGGRVDPLYNLANSFQGPRSARLQLTFFF
ncbi:MAG TPA: TonB-dependent receptor [Paludibaculum sp.]|jgi:hypothetical protein